jgi:hypothetical protein
MLVDRHRSDGRPGMHLAGLSRGNWDHLPETCSFICPRTHTVLDDIHMRAGIHLSEAEQQGRVNWFGEWFESRMRISDWDVD